MAKNGNQKLKIMYLMKIFLEKTDETHSITMPEILEELRAQGIEAERKSIYNDIENLRLFGIDIIGEQQDRTFYYRVANRQFELPELKLLVDSVQSAKFITAKKSNQLIKKIEGCASEHEAKLLHRQVFVADRVKTMNESIYYNVDKIHSAIGNNKKIRFQYFQWNVEKKMELRHNGEYYEVSPWALSWNDENYYLVAFETSSDKIKHFRVDKMLHIDLADESREGKSRFSEFNMALYAKKMFAMYSGEEQTVKLECENSMAGVIIDRFGKDVTMIKTDEEHFDVNVKVAVSRMFFSWIMGLGNGVKIIAPDNVVEQMKDEIERLRKQYMK